MQTDRWEDTCVRYFGAAHGEKKFIKKERKGREENREWQVLTQSLGDGCFPTKNEGNGSSLRYV